ncbi:hypothetical protein EDC01DRAFT_791043 [Geopyxis carbonaria]|nr:hypothetical protein EDC01DRAFT_791043 [Geopyxis carbonaria]
MSSVEHRQFEEQIDGFILQLIRSCWNCNKPPSSSPDGPPNWITACAHCVCTDCLYPSGVRDERQNRCPICQQENVNVTAVGAHVKSEIGDHFLPLFSSLDSFSSAVKFQLNAMAGRIQYVDNRYLVLKKEHSELLRVHTELQRKHHMQIQTLIQVRDELIVKRQYEREVEVLKSEIEHLRSELKIHRPRREDDILEKSPFKSYMDSPMKRKAAEEEEAARSKRFREQLEKSITKPPPAFDAPPQQPEPRRAAVPQTPRPARTPQDARRPQERDLQRFAMPPPPKFAPPVQQFRSPQTRDGVQHLHSQHIQPPLPPPQSAVHRRSTEYDSGYQTRSDTYDPHQPQHQHQHQHQRPATYDQRPVTYETPHSHAHSHRHRTHVHQQAAPHPTPQTPRNRHAHLPHINTGTRPSTTQYTRPSVFQPFTPLHRREEREDTSPYFGRNASVAPQRGGGHVPRTESLAELLQKGTSSFGGGHGATGGGGRRY